jgi:hypothetical protein
MARARRSPRSSSPPTSNGVPQAAASSRSCTRRESKVDHGQRRAPIHRDRVVTHPRSGAPALPCGANGTGHHRSLPGAPALTRVNEVALSANPPHSPPSAMPDLLFFSQHTFAPIQSFGKAAKAGHPAPRKIDPSPFLWHYQRWDLHASTPRSKPFRFFQRTRKIPHAGRR